MSSSSVQIVTYEGEFTSNLRPFIEDLNVRSTDYHTVAIIGSQSSGKSTLLNHLFNQSFDVLDIDRGRNQTTKGIHMGFCPDAQALLLDIEGTDSQERGDDGGPFEHMSALFALAVADVLMINMWTVEIGRYKGAGVSLLKTIFEVNLKLFANNEKQRILFVLRDFNHTENLTVLKQQISKTMEGIWEEISKPDSHRLLTVFDCFDFHFAVIASKVQAHPEFLQDIQALKERFFEKDRHDYIFKNQSADVPLDGYPTYLQSIWERVKVQKDLDIPSQKTLLSILRCGELKLEALAEYKTSLQKIVQQAMRAYVPDFPTRVQESADFAFEKYDSHAYQYALEVRQETREELQAALAEFVKDAFNVQIRMLLHSHSNSFKESLGGRIPKDKPIADFNKVTRELIDEAFAEFSVEVQKMLIPGIESPVQELYNKYLEFVQEKVKYERDRQISLLDEEVRRHFSGRCMQLIGKCLELGKDESLWNGIANIQQETLQSITSRIQEILKGMEMSDVKIQEYIENAQKLLYKNIKIKIKKFCAGLTEFLTRRFNDLFLKDNANKPRNWVNTDIPEVYTKAKDHCLRFLEVFRWLRITPDPEELEADTELTSVEFEELLDLDQYSTISEQFLQNTEVAYRDAKHIQNYGVSQRGIPTWVIGLILVLGWNDIVWIIQSPIIFYPTLLLGSGMALLYSMGLGSVPMFMLKQAYAMTKGNTKRQQQLQQIRNCVTLRVQYYSVHMLLNILNKYNCFFWSCLHQDIQQVLLSVQLLRELQLPCPRNLYGAFYFQSTLRRDHTAQPLSNSSPLSSQEYLSKQSIAEIVSAHQWALLTLIPLLRVGIYLLSFIKQRIRGTSIIFGYDQIFMGTQDMLQASIESIYLQPLHFKIRLIFVGQINQWRYKEALVFYKGY